MLVCDDYGFPLYERSARLAVDDFFERRPEDVDRSLGEVLRDEALAERTAARRADGERPRYHARADAIELGGLASDEGCAAFDGRGVSVRLLPLLAGDSKHFRYWDAHVASDVLGCPAAEARSVGSEGAGSNDHRLFA